MSKYLRTDNLSRAAGLLYDKNKRIKNRSTATVKDYVINRIYDGVEAKTRKSQASFQII